MGSATCKPEAVDALLDASTIARPFGIYFPEAGSKLSGGWSNAGCCAGIRWSIKSVVVLRLMPHGVKSLSFVVILVHLVSRGSVEISKENSNARLGEAQI